MQRRSAQSQLTKGMRELKQQVSEIGRLIPKDAPLLYCDFPIHQNFGDILIMLGSAAFLEHCGNPIIDSFADLSPQKIQSPRPQESVWILHGGGNFGDVWSSHQGFREQVIEAHPAERIISLPQTLHFSSPEGLERFARIAGQHKDLHLFWRDHVSFETAQRHFDCHNYLCPDMAHFLWPLAPAEPEFVETEQNLFLIRRDKEGAAVPAWVLAHREEFVDWRELVPPAYKVAYRAARVADLAGGVTGLRVPTFQWWLWAARQLLQRMATTFVSYDCIVTSRLHGHIFASLVGSRSILIDNSYGKNRTYYEAWTRTLGIAEFAGSQAEL